MRGRREENWMHGECCGQICTDPILSILTPNEFRVVVWQQDENNNSEEEQEEQ